MEIAERLEHLADAHREPVMLMFDYDAHDWSVWISLKGRAAREGFFPGLTPDEALGKAEEALEVDRG